MDKNKRPSMRDFDLISFVGNAPDWSEQGKKQEEFVKALDKWEKQEESKNNNNDN